MVRFTKLFCITFLFLQVTASARYYSSEMGRFINRDPIASPKHPHAVMAQNQSRQYGATGSFMQRDTGYHDGMSLYNGYFAERMGLDPSGLEFIEARNFGSSKDAGDAVLSKQVIGVTIGWSCHQCDKDETKMRKEIHPVDAGRDSNSNEELSPGKPEYLINKANKKHPGVGKKCFKMILRDFVVYARHTLYRDNFDSKGYSYTNSDGIFVQGLQSAIEDQSKYIQRAKIWYNANIPSVKNIFEVGCEFTSMKACREYGDKLSKEFRIHANDYAAKTGEHPFTLKGGPQLIID